MLPPCDRVHGSRPPKSIEKPEYAIPPYRPKEEWKLGLKFLTALSSFQIQLFLILSEYDFGSKPLVLEGVVSDSIIASIALSAANIPLFMALWVPLILGTFKNPAVQPTKQPPGN